MNTKSGTNAINWILPHRTKRGITLDLQKQMILFRKETEKAIIPLSHGTKYTYFWATLIFRIFSLLVPFLYFYIFIKGAGK